VDGLLSALRDMDAVVAAIRKAPDGAGASAALQASLPSASGPSQRLISQPSLTEWSSASLISRSSVAVTSCLTAVVLCARGCAGAPV
jgi:hypothetical protein